MKTLGDRLRIARTRRKMSQGALAVACGWSETEEEGQSRISNYELNKRPVSLEDCALMADILKADPAEIAFGHPLKPDPIEAEIIEDFRNADGRGRDYIISACDASRPPHRRRSKKSR